MNSQFKKSLLWRNLFMSLGIYVIVRAIFLTPFFFSSSPVLQILTIVGVVFMAAMAGILLDR